MEHLETNCSDTTNTVSIANTENMEENKKIEHLLIKSKRKIMQFNRYYLASFIILAIDFFMTIFYPSLFEQFFNIFFYIIFVGFAMICALKVKKAFNIIDISLQRDILLLLVLNGIVVMLLIFDLLYILSSKILTELNCIVSQSDCRITVKYFYECMVAFFLFSIINCFMVFIFFIKLNKLRGYIKETLSHNSINYIKPKELSNDNIREKKNNDLEID